MHFGFDSQCRANQIKSTVMKKYILGILSAFYAMCSVGAMWVFYNMKLPPYVAIFLIVSCLVFCAISCHLWEVELKKKEVEND